MITFHADSVEKTVELGKRLGQMLDRGDTVCLMGSMGAGKTAFTGGIAKGLEVEGYVTSPTFTIINEYEGRLPLYHMDVYRIGDPEELLDIGFDEYIGGCGVTVIEWAELVKGLLPDDRIVVTIEEDDPADMDSRLITIEFSGKKADEYERRLSHESTGD